MLYQPKLASSYIYIENRRTKRSFRVELVIYIHNSETNTLIMINTLFPCKRYSFENDTVLANLPKNMVSLIEEKKIYIKLKKKQVLFYESTIPTGVYILRSGKVKKYATGLNGKEHIFYLAKENEILGYHCLLSNETYAHTTACLTDCTFDLIPKSVFLTMIENDREMLYRLLRSISHEFGVFTNNTRILAQHSVRERTALSIIKLEKFFNENGMIKLSRKDHSSIVGTSIESLVRVLHDFKEEGAIELRESMIVTKDMKKLVKASNFV